MPRISSKHFENFGDGLLTICEADERSLTRTKLEHIRFGNRTVGVTRYWQAQTAGNQVDKLLAVPCLLYTSPSPRDRQKSRMPSSA